MVLPERADVNFSPIELEIGAKSANFQGKAQISIVASQVSIVLEIETDIDLHTIKNTVEYLIRVVVDSFGYLVGRGYDIEITSAVSPQNKHTVFGVGIPELEARQNERPVQFNEFFPLALQSIHLQRCLNDLREAIRSPFDTGFYCYRALESIRQSFVESNDSGEKSSWDRLNSSLRIEKSYSDELRKFALPQRHGNPIPMTGEERVRAMKYIWLVVDRYAMFLKEGNKPLPDEFPVLTDSKNIT